MKEIDVSKCEYKGGIECHIRDYPILNCVDVNIEDCHYKQLQQLKEHCKQIEETNKILYDEKCDLIKENEELKKYIDRAGIIGIIKVLKCLDEIKEKVKDLKNECFYEDFECADCDMTFACNYHKKYEILQKIKEARGE